MFVHKKNETLTSLLFTSPWFVITLYLSLIRQHCLPLFPLSAPFFLSLICPHSFTSPSTLLTLLDLSAFFYLSLICQHYFTCPWFVSISLPVLDLSASFYCKSFRFHITIYNLLDSSSSISPPWLLRTLALNSPSIIIPAYFFPLS